MSTTLTLHLSSAFLQEVTGSSTGTGGTGTQNGTWAYLWDNQPPADAVVSPLLPGATTNFTPLITAGQLTSNVTLGTDGNYDVVVNLTDSATPTVSSGTVYLIVQSEDPSSHHDLTSLIGSTEGNIQPNVEAWNYGYAQFEFTLQNGAADQGDLTAISGFGPHLAVNVSYSNGTSDSRGYAISGADMTTALTNLEPAAALIYPAATPPTTPFSPLDGQTSMVISPSNGNFGSSFYPSSNWSSYLTAFSRLTDISISGVTNGEVDASGIWHNGQYYSYTMSTLNLAAGASGAAGTYFEFSPTAASQTQGYMLISEATLQSNLYAAGQGTLTLWQDSGLTIPYVVPGSGLPAGTAPTSNAFNPSTNNEWGNIFTNVFTGFTAGYWGTTAQQSNPMNRGTTDNLAGGPINLDNSQNWSSSYAFDVNRIGTIPTTQHNDAYTQQFFNNSNVYGSAFSDNLSNGLTPGPLISLSQPGSATNVGNIDLYAYGSSEVDPYYRTPVGANYLPLPTGTIDYLIPTQTSGLQLEVVGQAAGLFVQAGATVQLGIYEGNGQFDYVTVQTGGNLWQNYTVGGSSSSSNPWTITPGGTNVQGTFFINNLPTPATAAAGGVYWYQLVFSDSSGDQKVFDFYATAGSTLGQVQTTATSVAADGGATFPANTLTPTLIQLDLNPAASLPSGLLTFAYNSQFSAMPAAPVIGTLSSSVFTAMDDQDGTGITGSGAPGVTIANAGALAFGWTGTNNGTHTGTTTNPVFNSNGTYTPGLVSAYTNKIIASDVAEVGFVNTATVQPLDMVLHATADLDGQWQTTTTVQLGNGSYSATMSELLSDGVTPFGPASALLTINVNIPTLSLKQTADGSGLEFAPHAALGNGGGNWLHFDPLPTDSHLPAGADLLLYATMPDGTLVDRDGHTGTDVTIDDATLARMGSIQSDGGAALLQTHQTFFLPDDEQLHFAILNKDGTINVAPEVHIAQMGGLLAVTAGGLGFSATVNNNVSDQTYLANEQRSDNLPVVHLTHGETVQVDIAGSAANANTLHFVRFDVDPSTGAMSVGGVAYGNTDAFRAAVQKNWDPGLTVQDGHGTFQDTGNWTVAGKSGFYAPVLATQNGDIFVIGTANVDGHDHVRVFGQNTFGFEDLRADQHGDFDYNDMVVQVTTKDWLVH
jgi:hypothetical protein